MLQPAISTDIQSLISGLLYKTVGSLVTSRNHPPGDAIEVPLKTYKSRGMWPRNFPQFLQNLICLRPTQKSDRWCLLRATSVPPPKFVPKTFQVFHAKLKIANKSGWQQINIHLIFTNFEHESPYCLSSLSFLFWFFKGVSCVNLRSFTNPVSEDQVCPWTKPSIRTNGHFIWKLCINVNPNSK